MTPDQFELEAGGDILEVTYDGTMWLAPSRGSQPRTNPGTGPITRRLLPMSISTKRQECLDHLRAALTALEETNKWTPDNPPSMRTARLHGQQHDAIVEAIKAAEQLVKDPSQ